MPPAVLEKYWDCDFAPISGITKILYLPKSYFSLSPGGVREKELGIYYLVFPAELGI